MAYRKMPEELFVAIGVYLQRQPWAQANDMLVMMSRCEQVAEAEPQLEEDQEDEDPFAEFEHRTKKRKTKTK